MTCGLKPKIFPVRFLNRKGGKMKRIEQSGKFPITLIVIFLCFSAAIIIAGTMFGSYISKKVKYEAESDLSAIADLKMQQILLWQKSRLAEADLLSLSPFYVNAAEELIANPGNRSLRMQMQERLNAQLKSQYWHDMILLDNKGKIVITAGSKITAIGDKTHELLDKVRLKRQPLMSEFYFCDICQTVHLDIIVPLFKLGHNMEPTKGFVGYTIMRLDPHVFLYPLIQSWPTPSKSSETLLVKKDGQDVLFLNELRFKKGTSLKFRIPLKQRSLPAAVAVTGSSGVFDGLDYRGVRVISHLRSIPGTDWHMVTKVDYDEVFSDLKRQEGLVFVIILVLIGLAASLTTAVFFAQRREHYKKLFIAETERQALVTHFDYLTKYANDIIFLLDENHNIREINDRGLEVYGYTREEIIGRSAATVRSDDQKNIFQSQMDELVVKGGMLYETRHKRKDGSTFPVEISARIIEIEGKKYLQGIVRDISERKQYELDIQERNEELESANQELMANEEELKTADEELRQQMEKLEESEERYRTTLDNMLEGCQIIDREFKYIYINDTAARHGRKAKEELIGKTMMEAYPGIQNAKLFPILQDCLKEKIPQHFENEFIYEDGSSGWFDLSMQPVPEGVFILSIDITKRKKAETDLRESEIKFQRIFDESSVGILIAGLDKRFNRCNKAMCDFLGYKEEELIGKTIAEITYPEDVELGMPELRQVVEGKIEKATIQKRYLHKSGGVVWGEVTISLIRGANNEPLYFLPIIQDINLRKQAEEALAKNRALLAESQEMAKIGGWEFDVVTMAQTWTEETFRILEVDTTQGEPKVPEGVDFIAPEYRDMAKTAIQRAIEHGEPYDQEWEVKTAKGNRRWVRVIAKANRENGKTKSVSGSFQDITVRKQAEEKIKQQISELQRWQNTMLDREDRVMELKEEVNRLLRELGREDKYCRDQ